MLNIEKLRKIDPELNGISDDEAIKIRDKYYELGRLIFDDWLDSVSGSKYPIGILHKLGESNKIQS